MKFLARLLERIGDYATRPSLWLDAAIFKTADWYFDKVHWTKTRAENQYQWYRCTACKGIVTWKKIKQQGGCTCGCGKVSPTMPKFGEKIQLLFLPWTV